MTLKDGLVKVLTASRDQVTKWRRTDTETAHSLIHGVRGNNRSGMCIPSPITRPGLDLRNRGYDPRWYCFRSRVGTREKSPKVDGR
jgi:hypothetical protein